MSDDRKKEYAKGLRAFADSVESGEIGFMMVVIGDREVTEAVGEVFELEFGAFTAKLTTAIEEVMEGIDDE